MLLKNESLLIVDNPPPPSFPHNEIANIVILCHFGNAPPGRSKNGRQVCSYCIIVVVLRRMVVAPKSIHQNVSASIPISHYFTMPHLFLLLSSVFVLANAFTELEGGNVNAALWQIETVSGNHIKSYENTHKKKQYFNRVPLQTTIFENLWQRNCHLLQVAICLSVSISEIDMASVAIGPELDSNAFFKIFV